MADAESSATTVCDVLDGRDGIQHVDEVVAGLSAAIEELGKAEQQTSETNFERDGSIDGVAGPDEPDAVQNSLKAKHQQHLDVQWAFIRMLSVIIPRLITLGNCSDILFDILAVPLLIPLLSAGSQNLDTTQIDSAVHLTMLLVRASSNQAQVSINEKLVLLVDAWAKLRTSSSLSRSDPFASLFNSLTSPAGGRSKEMLSLLASSLQSDHLNRNKHALLILSIISSNYNNLDPSTVAATNLLQALIATLQNDTNPSIITHCCSSLALMIPLVREHITPQIFQSILDLLSQLVHWDVICNAMLRVTKMGTRLDAFMQQNQSNRTFDAANNQVDWNIDGMEEQDFIIQMDDLEASDEFWGSSSLLQSILASDSRRNSSTALNVQPDEASPSALSSDGFDVILNTVSATNIRRSIDTLFTALYALAPSSCLEALKVACKQAERGWTEAQNTRKSVHISRGSFVQANDSFRLAFLRLVELEVLDEGLLVKQRVTNLIKAHRMHPEFLFGPQTLAQELKTHTKQYSSKSASEVLVDVLLFRCNTGSDTGLKKRSEPDQGVGGSQFGDYLGEPSKVENPADDVGGGGADISLQQVLQFNRSLRKAVLDHTAPVRPLQSHTSPTPMHASDATLHHLLLLLGELNYELCVRSAFMEQVSELRKEQFVQAVAIVDQENVYQRLRSQQQELAALQSNIEQLRSESATTRDRQRTYEEDLNRRLRSARDSAREEKEAHVKLQEVEKELQVEIMRLNGALGVAEERIHRLEQDLHLVAPALERMAQWENSATALTNQFVQRELDSTNRINLQKRIELLESQILALELKLTSSETEAENLKSLLESLEPDVGASKKVEEMADRLRMLQVTNEERIRAVESKYQLLKQINFALETRLFELE
ncbi:hypothetical protein CcCBS67573_g00379 [Chytriomyces confervae]|uniref:Uncharacterized protein n=1 Tax=Chytriomyces confervae TaxID=246404 RepID=A0A507FQ32_9FUNG|nr:hypothetical protein CcCBS67573_g00379 [Chytriomyces confervae]